MENLSLYRKSAFQRKIDKSFFPNKRGQGFEPNFHTSHQPSSDALLKSLTKEKWKRLAIWTQARALSLAQGGEKGKTFSLPGSSKQDYPCSQMGSQKNASKNHLHLQNPSQDLGSLMTISTYFHTQQHGSSPASDLPLCHSEYSNHRSAYNSYNKPEISRLDNQTCISCSSHHLAWGE